ncbi:MAG: hypothetical protein J1E39_06590 [Eubacterium sp.]|nr:hypothetical protein [Eubacterium sp.]
MSKTMFVTVIIGCILLFSACEGAGAPMLRFDGDVGFSGELKCETLTAQADFARSDGDWTVTFTSPESISGLTLSISGENVSATLDGISFEFPDEGMRFKSAATYVTDVIDMLDESVSAQKDGETLSVSGTNQQGNYKITADASGKLLSVSSAEVTFTAFADEQQ